MRILRVPYLWLLRRLSPVRVNAFTALVAFTARRVFTGKRVGAAALLLAVAPLIALVVVTLGKPSQGAPAYFDLICFHLSLFLVLVLIAMIYGVALTSGEIEDGTAGYLLLAANPRWLIALVHVVVTAAILAALCTASMAVTYGVCAFSPQGLPPRGVVTILGNGLVAWVALTVYLAFFVFCGYAFRHNLAVSVGTVLVWEVLIQFLPIKLAAYTVVWNARVLWRDIAHEGERGRFFRVISGFDLPDYGEASMFLSVAAAAFLTLGMVAAMNRSIAGREAS